MSDDKAIARKLKADELKARIAAREAEANEKTADRDLADLEVLDSLQQQHGVAKIRSVSVPTPPEFPGIVVFREPGNAYKEYVTLINRASTKVSEKLAAQQDMVVECALFPERETLLKMFDQQHGLVQSLALEVMRFAGGLLEEKGKE